MAPNTKHSSLIAQQLLDLRVVRAKVSNDYQAPTPVVDSASYWEWPTESSPDFSMERVELNLINSARPLVASSELNAEHDDYWAEESDHAVENVQVECQTALQEKVDSHDYWAEKSHKTESCDDYWNTASTVTRTVVRSAVIRNPTIAEAESAVYWQEKTHGRSHLDAYWREDLPSQNYWTWNVAAKTKRDDYWEWASSVPTF